MNVSRIDSEGRNRNYIYQLLDRIPKREYQSSIRMNISRIDSTKKGSRIYNYKLLGRRLQRGGNPSSVRMNISKINPMGNENRDHNYLLLGRIPKREYPSSKHQINGQEIYDRSKKVKGLWTKKIHHF